MNALLRLPEQIATHHKIQITHSVYASWVLQQREKNNLDLTKKEKKMQR